MTTLARRERHALADLMEAVGPDAPTLSGDWTSRDLAAHLVLRERRPDAAAGILLRPLEGYTRVVQDHLAGQDWARLVAKVRSGPLLMPDRIDKVVNTAEFFVHHEDVRRAQEQWQPRELTAADERSLWRLLCARGGALFRKATGGVVLQLPDGTEHQARPGEPAVTLVGPASELLLYAYGRTGHAQVRIDGDPEAVAAFARTSLAV